MKEAWACVVGQAERVKRIVGDLLEFARGREPQLTEVDLPGLISEAFRRLGSVRNTDNVRFSLDAGPGRIVLSADQGQLEQVFNNLFANAVDAMNGRGNLSVSVRETGGSAVIIVSDSGAGIPRESIDKIFEPFFSTKDKGTGLGLAIVYNIIKKHGGDIAVESEEGKGAVFKITLPAVSKK